MILQAQVKDRGEAKKVSFQEKSLKKGLLELFINVIRKRVLSAKRVPDCGLGLEYFTPAVKKEPNSLRKSFLEKKSSYMVWLSKSKAMAIQSIAIRMFRGRGEEIPRAFKKLSRKVASLKKGIYLQIIN